MPNWTEAKMTVILPAKNRFKFLHFFEDYDSETHTDNERHFYRTQLLDGKMMPVDKKNVKLEIVFLSAWSVWSCLFDCDEQDSYITLEKVIKKTKVLRLTVNSDEPGIGFKEVIEWNGHNLHYDCIEYE